ncbi:t-SNARE [Catenaria anguillulae PL171]|uniref:t-SNARE n=1 Tax=Catenaria anguillulae PL171 TaxID=765915 RepID=A0A1Y2I008_9FUNG|nr:t-SNARE [Catenaria anguillulae PL171]
MSTSPPDFQTALARVAQGLQSLQRNIDTFHSRVRLLGTPRDTVPFRSKLHDLQESTTAQLARISDDLKLLDTAAAATGLTENKATAQRLATDFSAMMLKFKAAQKEYASKSQADIARARAALEEEEDRMERDDVPLLGGSGSASQVLRQQQQQQQVHELEVAYNETLIAEREAEIRDIEEGVHMVNDIFRKIGSMVRDQGALFDNIEANLESAQVNTENANHELTRANKRQRSWREFKCWCLVVLIAICALLGLILFLVS